MQEGNVTLKMIAAEAQVSIGTVDRALNNRGRINTQTKTKVLAVAKRLGYKPNAVARILSKNKSYTIAVVVPEQPQDFFGIILQGMKDAASELIDYKISVKYYFTQRLAWQPQKVALDRVIQDADEIDGLVINIADTRSKSYIDHFTKRSKPVITYNSDVPEIDRLCYIGQNMRDAGMVAGELMGKMLRGEGELAIVTGFRHVLSVTERSEGFVNVIRDEYPGIRIVDEQECEDDVDRAEQIAVTLMKEHPNLQAIYCGDAVCTLGVGRMMRKIANNNHIVVVGCDLGQESKNALLNGDISAVVCQDPYTQGYYAIKCMSRIFLEERLPEKEFYYTQHKIVIKHNCTDEDIGDIHENSFHEKMFG